MFLKWSEAVRRPERSEATEFMAGTQAKHRLLLSSSLKYQFKTHTYTISYNNHIYIFLLCFYLYAL